jgi:predicted ATPase
VISEVRVRNFKCFTQLDLPLYPFTLLSGINSTGKSTVLQALLLLRQSELADHLERGRLALNGDLVRLGTADATLPENASRRVLELAIDWRDGATAAFRFEANGEDFEQSSASSRDVYVDRPPFKKCRYVSADRTGPRAAFPMSDAFVREGRHVGSHGEYVAHYLAAFGEEAIRIPSLHRSDAASLKLRHEVEAWLGMLSRDVQIHPRLHTSLDVAELGFTFPGPAGRTNEQRSTHVGFGLTYVLPILVAVLCAEPGDLVMLENPEAHLHPKAQREIAHLLAQAAAADVQIIIETHSDHVLNGARLAVKNRVLGAEGVGVHFFTHDPSTGARNVLSPRIEADGAIREWPTGFFDEWDRSLDELLTK